MPHPSLYVRWLLRFESEMRTRHGPAWIDHWRSDQTWTWSMFRMGVMPREAVGRALRHKHEKDTHCIGPDDWSRVGERAE